MPIFVTSSMTPPLAAAVVEERGLHFEVGNAFYRSQSAVGRDLGVLAAVAYKRQHGQLRALDAMCGCGVRALRYLVHANADFVWANDAFDELQPLILSNLQKQHIQDEQQFKVTCQDANKLLLGCYIQDDFYDLIDVDSFGGNSVFLGSALASLKRHGLVYVTSTDGFSCSKRPYNALASYGTFTRRLPFINEIGLRMLVGGVVREAATRNMNVSPVFSHFAPHGPVFRVMLRMIKGKANLAKCYGFIAYCRQCGETQTISWEKLGQLSCSCETSSYEYTGPLWTGPLHNMADVEQISQIAMEFGWASKTHVYSNKKKDDPQKLKELLDIMKEESNPDLPCGFIELKEIASKGKFQGLKRDRFMEILHRQGFSVGRSHIEPNAIKTDASFFQCMEVAKTACTYT